MPSAYAPFCDSCGAANEGSAFCESCGAQARVEQLAPQAPAAVAANPYAVGYAPAAYPPAYAYNPSNGSARAALLLAVIPPLPTLLLLWLPIVGWLVGLLATLCYVLAIVFGVRGRRQIASSGESGAGMATAGIVVASIMLAIGAVFTVITLVVALLVYRPYY